MKSTSKIAASDANDARLRDGDLASRLKLLLINKTPDRGRFSALETLTLIPAATWRTWWTRGAVPSGALVEAAAKCWPQHAYWLVTGKTDIRCGHDMPSTEGTAAQGYVSNWPESSCLLKPNIQTGFSHEYLKLTMELNENGDTQSASFQLKKDSLDSLAKRRKEEISKNFDIPLLLESRGHVNNGDQEN